MKRIIRYLLFTFALTYLAHGILAFTTAKDFIEFDTLIGQSLFILGGSSPTIFAFVFVFRHPDPTVKESFKKSLLSYRHPLPLWLFALGIPIVLGGLFQLSHMLFDNQLFESELPFYYFFVVIFSSVLFGGIEEIGWRGFLQERLAGRKNLVVIAVLIGLIWGLWHVPLFFIENVSHYNFDFLPFLLGAVMFSTYLTWLYAKTRSLLLVVLLHASINASATIGLRFVFRHDVVTYGIIIIFTLIGCSLLMVYEKNKKNEEPEEYDS